MAAFQPPPGTRVLISQEGAQDFTSLTMRAAFEASGFVVTWSRGNEYELELPNRSFEDETGADVSADFTASVETGADGTVIELEHITHGSPLRAAYGKTEAAAAVAAKLTVEEWIVTATQAADRGYDYPDWRD